MAEAKGLKPCPFCGGAAEVERQGTNRQSHIVRCTNCGCSHEGPDEDTNPERWHWNERSGEDAMAGELVSAAATLQRAGACECNEVS